MQAGRGLSILHNGRPFGPLQPSGVDGSDDDLDTWEEESDTEWFNWEEEFGGKEIVHKGFTIGTILDDGDISSGGEGPWGSSVSAPSSSYGQNNLLGHGEDALVAQGKSEITRSRSKSFAASKKGTGVAEPVTSGMPGGSTDAHGSTPGSFGSTRRVRSTTVTLASMGRTNQERSTDGSSVPIRVPNRDVPEPDTSKKKQVKRSSTQQGL
jgi:hypothetical protein